MARYNMNEEVKEIAEITGRTEKEIAEELELEFIEKPFYGDAWYASNRRKEHSTKVMLQEVKSEAKKAKFRAAKQGDAKAFTEPFFTKSGDAWAVVARGIDFITDGYGAQAIKVRKRNGSVSTVNPLNPVDTTCEQVKVYEIR